MRIHRLYVAAFVLGTTVFFLAFGTGLYQSLRTERRPPGITTGYGKSIEVLFQQKDYKQAIDQMQLVLKLDPDPSSRLPVHYNLGLVFSQQGNLVEAAAHFERALAIQPDFADAHYHLGVTLLKQGNRVAAAAHFQEALRLKPDYAAARTMLQRVRAELENQD
jgi:tetratricopeptide (TPR) repeat protein